MIDNGVPGRMNVKKSDFVPIAQFSIPLHPVCSEFLDMITDIILLIYWSLASLSSTAVYICLISKLIAVKPEQVTFFLSTTIIVTKSCHLLDYGRQRNFRVIEILLPDLFSGLERLQIQSFCFSLSLCGKQGAIITILRFHFSVRNHWARTLLLSSV